jgi:hypothetical protein
MVECQMTTTGMPVPTRSRRPHRQHFPGRALSFVPAARMSALRGYLLHGGTMLLLRA